MEVNGSFKLCPAVIQLCGKAVEAVDAEKDFFQIWQELLSKLVENFGGGADQAADGVEDGARALVVQGGLALAAFAVKSDA